MMDENGIAKLGDFGSAERFSQGNDTLMTTIGTYQFFSPECCNPEVKTFSGKANDVWALGVTLYTMIYNQLPFWADTEMGVLELIHQGEFKFLDTRTISPGLRNLLLKMLEKNPERRATLKDLKQDPWLNEGFAVSLDSKEADFIANFTEEELVSKGVPMAAILFAKTLAKKWLKQDARPSLLAEDDSIDPQPKQIALIKSLAPIGAQSR
jgi:[calcium/calmodulin-dependent protein kinase] kinase